MACREEQNGSYNDLAGLNEMRRVTHSRAYQAEDGTNTNQVESFFSRVASITASL